MYRDVYDRNQLFLHIFYHLTKSLNKWGNAFSEKTAVGMLLMLILKILHCWLLQTWSWAALLEKVGQNKLCINVLTVWRSSNRALGDGRVEKGWWLQSVCINYKEYRKSWCMWKSWICGWTVCLTVFIFMCSLINWTESAICFQQQLNIEDHGDGKRLFTASSNRD